MKIIAIFFCLMLSVNSEVHAEWMRISDSTIRLSGDIQKGDFERYLELAKEGYSKLELRSFGGVPLIALKIADDVVKRRVEVVIDGYCFSACANYLALSGKTLTVPCDSLVGWHGSPTNKSNDEVAKESFSEGHPKELTSILVNWISDFRERELRFYKVIGVNISLLHDSVVIPGKLKRSQPIVNFKFDQETGDISISKTVTAVSWIPGPNILEKYGVVTSGYCHGYTQEDVRTLLVKYGMAGMYFSLDEL